MATDIPNNIPQIGEGTLAILRSKGIKTNVDVLYDSNHDSRDPGNLATIPGIGPAREALLREWAERVPLTEKENFQIRLRKEQVTSWEQEWAAEEQAREQAKEREEEAKREAEREAEEARRKAEEARHEKQKTEQLQMMELQKWANYQKRILKILLLVISTFLVFNFTGIESGEDILGGVIMWVLFVGIPWFVLSILF